LSANDKLDNCLMLRHETMRVMPSMANTFLRNNLVKAIETDSIVRFLLPLGFGGFSIVRPGAG
jgi:hypothetical protein